VDAARASPVLFIAEGERRDREDFIIESSRLMHDRFLFQEVWEQMGMPVDECVESGRASHRLTSPPPQPPPSSDP